MCTKGKCSEEIKLTFLDWKALGVVDSDGITLTNNATSERLREIGYNYHCGFDNNKKRGASQTV